MFCITNDYLQCDSGPLLVFQLTHKFSLQTCSKSDLKTKKGPCVVAALSCCMFKCTKHIFLMSIFKFCFCFESLAGFWWPLDNLKCFYSHQKTSLAQRPALLLCMDKISVLIYILSHSLSHECSICRNLLTLSSLRLDPHGNSMTF